MSNVLNTLLIPPILGLIYLIIFPSIPKSPKVLPDTYNDDQYNWIPAKHPDVACYSKYGPKELAKFDGKDGGRICLAIMKIGRDGKVPEGGKGERTVFDVSNGRNFYGPGESCMTVLYNADRSLPLIVTVLHLTFHALQTACTEISPAETPLEEWPSSHLTTVRLSCD